MILQHPWGRKPRAFFFSSVLPGGRREGGRADLGRDALQLEDGGSLRGAEVGAPESALGILRLGARSWNRRHRREGALGDVGKLLLGVVLPNPARQPAGRRGAVLLDVEAALALLVLLLGLLEALRVDPVLQTAEAAVLAQQGPDGRDDLEDVVLAPAVPALRVIGLIPNDTLLQVQRMGDCTLRRRLAAEERLQVRRQEFLRQRQLRDALGHEHHLAGHGEPAVVHDLQQHRLIQRLRRRRNPLPLGRNGGRLRLPRRRLLFRLRRRRLLRWLLLLLLRLRLRLRRGLRLLGLRLRCLGGGLPLAGSACDHLF
mmetsp:Transcript_24201/g.78050  ORF Transcript_24201/g.78050 Transcript_24201/m.78050 type:complete len:314 (-) Transcript_24201:60-1001(-)